MNINRLCYEESTANKSGIAFFCFILNLFLHPSKLTNQKYIQITNFTTNLPDITNFFHL